ncbi:FHA domain-containing protein [Kamptonema sp. UHCC 0994]|uniref:FHA domain-containing protein n=1 Tax=Kamptonema sp. UHCC 0994 TaxID=3031329 RepID=UPI0023B90473|nr:FHA domain-containing protein [Kamptonema sp. UHCC 0994]MDF0554367.1 FHA domain-containing protein [Kamptonema sp. UHCC 0994]
MYSITLEWTEAGQLITYTIHGKQASKNLGTVRIGRDRTRCDLVVSDPTVSGLHVEIFFNDQENVFYLRNLRDSNPPLVDGRIVNQGEVVLVAGSYIYLGQVEMKVVSVSVDISRVPPTILLPPLANVALHPSPTGPTEYGLKCPKCLHISPYSQLDIGCPWCGTSLAAAVSVVLPPSGSQ